MPEDNAELIEDGNQDQQEPEDEEERALNFDREKVHETLKQNRLERTVKVSQSHLP